MIMKTKLVLEQMTLEEKIGQMFVTGFPGAEMSEEFQNLVKEEKIGNVILFQYNELEKGQIERLCTDISELIKEQTGILPFITSDEEGGIVSRLPEKLAKFPSAMALAHLSQSEEIRRSAWLTGKQLKSLGINFNLAPVLDVNSNPENPVIGVRSYRKTLHGLEMCERSCHGISGVRNSLCRKTFSRARGYQRGFSSGTSGSG